MAKNSGSVWMVLAVAFAALSGLLGFQLLNQSGPSAAAGVPEIVATVNSEEITKDMLFERLVSGQDEMLQRLVDDLINDRLIEQEAGKAGISVSAADVQAEVDKIKSQFSAPGQFEMALSQAQMTIKDLERRTRVTLFLTKILAPRVADQVTEEAMREYYDQNKDLFATQREEIKARHILVDSEAEALAARQRLVQGEDFAAVAGEVSKDQAANAAGGDLGWFGRGRMVAEFDEAAFALPVSQISQPVQTQFGWHIIEVLDHKQEIIPSFEQAKERVKEELTNSEIFPLVDDWIAEIRSQANIKKFLEPAGS